MNERVTPVQPPGLMKKRLVHCQEHHQGHKAKGRESDTAQGSKRCPSGSGLLVQITRGAVHEGKVLFHYMCARGTPGEQHSFLRK